MLNLKVKKGRLTKGCLNTANIENTPELRTTKKKKKLVLRLKEIPQQGYNGWGRGLNKTGQTGTFLYFHTSRGTFSPKAVCELLQQHTKLNMQKQGREKKMYILKIHFFLCFKRHGCMVFSELN